MRVAHGMMDNLAWMTESKPAQRELGFATMSKGWAIESDAFKMDLIAEHREKVPQKALERPEWAEARKVYLQNELELLLRSQKKTAADITKERKSAE